MTIPGSANPLLLASSGSTQYQVQRSLRFNSSDSAYLSRTPASLGNRRTWTWSGWVKRSALGSGAGNAEQYLFRGGADGTNNQGAIIIGSDTLYFIDNYSTSALYVRTTAVFRDPSAWYHFVVSVDTTQATASNRAKLYVNGVEQTSLQSATYPSQNYDTFINDTQPHTIGRRDSSFPRYFDGYLADIHFIDGQALTPSSFTEVSATTGQLIPKKYTGTFTGNSFWLQFADNSAATATTLGKDSSGLGNNWTPNNLSVTAGAGNDSLVDTPTSYGTDDGLGGSVRGNYCTWSPIYIPSTHAASNGNLEVARVSGAGFRPVRSTIGVASGKWYFEFTSTTANQFAYAGVMDQTDKFEWTDGQVGLGDTAAGYACYFYSGNKRNSASEASYGSAYASGDVMGVALDLDNGKIWFSKNGTWFASGDPAAGTNAAYTGLTGTKIPAASLYDTNKIIANFGQRPFAYTAPSGFKALCDTNLPAPVVAKPSTVMDVALWSGNNAARDITGLGFSPDLVWLKSRSVAGSSHRLFDAVRGVTKAIYSNLTNAEATESTALTAFLSNGFSLGDGDAAWNRSGDTYVAWTWDAGTTTSSNVAGSITSSVRANATSGFSVATYTGTGANATVGHGLGVAPGLVIVKCRSAANDWAVYHSANTSDPKTDYLLLNSTAATADDNTYWNDTAPTSTVFSIGTNADVNTNTATYVAYCWAPLAGYSSFGSYVGNGSADGVFQWCGFRPRWLLIKSSSGATENWVLIDSARDTYNVAGTYLLPNLANAEGSSLPVDLLSNGFKLRGSGGTNQSAVTYVWAAFAESPFAYSRAR